MIITRIKPSAGLGNQMFMYSAGLAASLRLGTELRLGTWGFERNTRNDRPYHLNIFPGITEPEASFVETFRICPGIAMMNFIHRKPVKKYHILRRLLRKITVKYIAVADKIYRPSYFSYSSEFLGIENNTMIDGYWESEKIFADVAGTVREKFRFPPEYFASDMAGRITSCNSVAVHVRRGDKSEIGSCFLTTDEYYLKAAIGKILSLTEKAAFFVFSDDIEWCKETLPKIYDTEYIFVEGNTPPNDMALMTVCRYFIVGTSSFSWWGAWLNSSPRKIVIAPAVKFWSENVNDRQDLIPESWIKIS